MDWINDVLRDVAELPDRNSPAEWPEAMLVTAQELHQILEAHWPAPSMPVNARLLEALRANHQWHIDHDEDDGYPGSDLEATNLGAIAAAEAKQVEPVRLTNADIVGLIQAWNATDFSGVVDLILSVESAVLRRNGINPQAKGD